MADIRDRLKELNPDLFSMTQPSVEHEVVLVGRRDKINPKQIDYLLKTKPTALAIAAKIKPSDYIHATLKPLGTIKENTIGGRSFSGPKKARALVIFQTRQPDLYQFLKEGIYESYEDDKGKTKWKLVDATVGTWKEAGFDAKKNPQIKLRDTVFGRKITFMCDPYTPHSVNENGEIQALTATTRDPKTGKYEDTEVVIGSYEFFADDDDLGKLLEVCARHYSKDIEPWLVESSVDTKVVTKGGTTTTKTVIKAPKFTGVEDYIIDADGNATDDQGTIVMSKEDLEELGHTGLAEGDTVKLQKVA
jgi:hypothetical protein